ncbi:unnamed protein product [Fraxinus pennsylvanica]|uniref:RING-type domain-containing protein n=1 Tax=Fraxinus pennsylvanica TaxID=56036 RepID=A0AAD2EDQ8_9LAMI|nr:unnamed protein product [Fraxinus pennsylvanica]
MKRQVVDDKYTKPQGLYQLKDVDKKKLRKLILESKLAPCYPGDDECGCDLDECPICFLYYPSLNRSRCCKKSICTECFLQMRSPNSTRPTQCPFCKNLNYAVEYRGVRTKEEKCLEQIEEQRVIEAKIRIRKQELQNEEERLLKRREISSSSSRRRPSEVDYCSTAEPSIASSVHKEEIVTCEESHVALAVTQPSRPRQNSANPVYVNGDSGECSGAFDAPLAWWHSPILCCTLEDVFDLDLEDIMVMEAIWRSIQEKDRQQHDPPPDSDAALSQECMVEDRVSSWMAPIVGSSSSGGLACAIADLAEHQQKGREPSNQYGKNMSVYNMPACSRISNCEEQESERYFPVERAIVASPNSQLASYTDCEEFDNNVRSAIRPEPNENECSFRPAVRTIVP